jgi:hypothetical protein
MRLSRHALAFPVIAGCALLPLTRVAAQTAAAELNALIDETQKRSPASQDLTLVWWLPDEFWRLSVASNPSIPPEAADSVVARVHRFVIVAALSGRFGSMANVSYASSDSLRANLRLVDPSGTVRSPLPPSAIPAPTQELLDLLRPMMANLLGNMGQSMTFVVFDGLSADGRRLIDPLHEGQFTIQLFGTDFRWRLPLSALVPRKRCPVDGELLSGAWLYCPWHGAKLEATQ